MDPHEIRKSGAVPELLPVNWCVRRLKSSVKVVTPEELILFGSVPDYLRANQELKGSYI